MAKRDVQLDIKVTGEDQINSVNQSLEETSLNAEQIANSTLKLTKGIAGGFELAAQAAGLFGEETGKAFEETVQRATQYIALSNALKDVAEGFSSENIKGLVGIAKGFTQAGVGAQLFGTVTRAAIAATGIGLLVIALGLLVANWEDVTKAVGGFIDTIPFLKSIKDTITDLVERVGSLGNLFKAVGAAITGLFKSGKSAVDEFNKSLESSKAIDALKKQSELIKEANSERSDTLKLLQEEGASKEKILALQKLIASTELQNLKDRKAAGEELSKEDEKRIKQLELEIKLIDIRTTKAVEAARKEAFFKKNEEIKAAMERQEELDKISKEDEEKRLKAFNDSNKKILESWKETSNDIGEITIESEKEVYDEVDAISKERTAAILDIQEKLKTNAAQKLTDLLLEEEIAFLESKKELTLEEEELLNELKAEKRAEDFENILEYVDAAASTLNEISGVITENIQKNIEGIQFQIDSINTQFQESVANREALEAQLSESEGARREQILADIDAEKNKEKELAAQRKKLQNEQIAAQNKANQIEYANAVIQSVVLTAKAVLAALATTPPASFALAAITAVLAAVQTGVVIANKPKTIPSLASGGFTPNGTGAPDATGERPVNAQLHEQEWVAPRWMVQSREFGSMIGQLEEARSSGKKSFAAGGFATTPTITNTGDQGTQALMAALQGMNLQVAVTEINSVQSRVQVIEDRASV